MVNSFASKIFSLILNSAEDGEFNLLLHSWIGYMYLLSSLQLGSYIVFFSNFFFFFFLHDTIFFFLFSLDQDEFCTFMQLEYAEKEDSYLRSKEVCENTVFTLVEIKSCLPGNRLRCFINDFSRRVTKQFFTGRQK